MRKVNPRTQEQRKRKILQSVIHHYIKTAKPVGSQVLTDGFNLDLSPATIRNIMSELEDEGFLTHPHTSAGRIPTDKGYRNYVNSLIELQKLSIDEEERVNHEYQGKIREIEDLLSRTSKILSALSHYSGFVIAPITAQSMIKYIELMPIEDKKALAIIVTNSGLVKHQMIDIRIPPERLRGLNMRLNESLKGILLSDAKKRILEFIEESERNELDIFSLARNVMRQMFDSSEHLYIGGTSNVLSLPEFHDFESMKCLLKISEDKDLILRAISDDIARDGVNVFIGSEKNCKELQKMSIVSSVCKNGENPVGLLGIIGPKRMEYKKMMTLVSAVTKVFNKMISELGG